MAVKLADTLAPMGDFPVAEAGNVSIDINGTTKDLQTAYEDGDLGAGGSSIQVDQMPLASAANLGKVLQYIGASGTYQQNYFYACVSDGEATPTYSWIQVNVQPSNAQASQISYDNTTSGLIADDAQEAIDEIATGLGTASAKDFTDTVRPNSHDLVESGSVYSAINNALESIYTPRGDLSCAELTSALLIADNVGSVYQMSDSGTTSALFINGAGITISAGDNVGIIKAGADTYMFNYMGNAFDLTDYQKKDLTTPITVGGQSQTTVEGALVGINNSTLQNTANFAPAFSEVTSYAVGDYCTYNNVLYRCTTAHTAGAWVAGHFTQVTVGGDLSAIVPSDASSSNKLVSNNTLNEWKGVNDTSSAYKLTRTAVKGGCALFSDVFGNTYMVSSGDQSSRFSVRQINVVGNPDSSKYWNGNEVCYISAVTFSLTLIAVFGSLDYEAIPSHISTAPSGTTEYNISTSIPINTVTSGSTAPVTSGGVYDVVAFKYATSVTSKQYTFDFNTPGISILEIIATGYSDVRAGGHWIVNCVGTFGPSCQVISDNGSSSIQSCTFSVSDTVLTMTFAEEPYSVLVKELTRA